MKAKQIEALKTADEYLDNLEKGIINVFELIQEGNEQQGIKTIPQIADGMDWVSQVIEKTREVQEEEIRIGDINEYLEQIIEALENEDYILVGDLFNYEILPIMERAHKEIKTCIEKNV